MNGGLKRLALAVALFGAGCGGDSKGGSDDAPGGSGGGGGAAGGAPGGGGEGGEGGAGGAPVEQALMVRAPGRMTIEQLARSIPVVTGGLRWMEDFGTGPVDMLEVLAPTLGAPDYLLVTEENLEPTIIVAKFMQDASHRICTRWIEADRMATPAERTFVRHDDWDSLADADVNHTLRMLQLRFFAKHVPADQDAPIADLRELFQNASSTAATPANKARDGWLAVCIALMTDPEFILY
jgi:hypothetical protein